ncbi:M23 family metallopeptidase [Siminovitchia fortis]|uniref:M23 family metallopeptidase n=1 Tax=Siminovitchia fortis TaxID=254758 RepID=UPI001642CC54|nr:M23 family metallopeptidase [Siminovitchia fortis]
MKVFDGYRISSPYGWRVDPFRGGREFHAGIDLVKADKSPIYAFTEGTVLFSGIGQSGTGLGGYGNVVVIKDKNGCAQLYGHLSKIAVRKGMLIKKDQVIGYQGSTGIASGSHLHYEIRKKSSPNYGWTANKEKSTLAPISYLQSYYPDKQKSANGSSTYRINKTMNGYISANDAKHRINKKTTVKAGTYFVFKISDGMMNVTSKKGVPGSWINPLENPVNIVIPEPQPRKKLILPKSASSWRVYPLNKKPVKGNEIGFLNPKKFGGLEYEILGNSLKYVYTIQTANFGKVNIYAAPDTGAKVK